MTFPEYLIKQPSGEGPKADFISDAAGDMGLPNAKTWAELHGYLRRVKACREAIAAGKLVWADYEAALAEAAGS